MIVAEISQNFTNLSEAKELVRLAKEFGGDLAKAQLFDSAKLYKEKNPAELTKEQAFELFNYGKQVGIEVFFSVFDVERVKWCEEMGVKRFKIAARKAQDEVLMIAISLTLKPCIISCDCSEHKWIFQPAPNAETKLLYCISKYPTQLTDLKEFKSYTLFQRFNGFSDHFIGLDASKIAIARGAKIIEKHFALTHDLGVDAPWSMIPSELKELRRFYDVVQEAL